jgi:putative flippase GtrA
MRTRRRITGFLLVGSFVLVFGLVLLRVLVESLHWNESIAYIVQAVASIELNFLLNKSFNWRDRRGSWKEQWLKFNGSRVVTFVLEQLLYNLLLAIGTNYLLAKILNAAILLVVDYVLNNSLIFRQREG